MCAKSCGKLRDSDLQLVKRDSELRLLEITVPVMGLERPESQHCIQHIIAYEQSANLYTMQFHFCRKLALYEGIDVFVLAYSN